MERFCGMQASDYFADEARLHSLCSTQAHRILSPPDEHADTILSPNEVLSNLSEGVAHRVLRCTPPDRLDHALAVLAQAWHPEVVRACFPSISSHSSLSLDCSCAQHPQATLTRVLQALCNMPPLHSLELLKLPPTEGHGAPPEPLRHAMEQACKAPKQVSLEFSDAQMCDPVMPMGSSRWGPTRPASRPSKSLTSAATTLVLMGSSRWGPT